MQKRSDREIQREFRARQTRQIVAVTAAVFLVLLAAMLYKRPDLLGAFSSRTLFGLQAITGGRLCGRGEGMETKTRLLLRHALRAVRQLLPQCWFDETKCAEGLDALERYRYEWSPELQMFSMKPEHSKWSHAADALRTFAVGYEEPPDDDG